MEKFTISTIYRTLIICCLGIFLTNCEGEDGAIGPSGNNGTDGIIGTDGNNGTNGENGVGFDQLLKHGSIKLTFTGKRPDNNIAFTDSNTFEFTKNEDRLNILNIDQEYNHYEVARFLSAPGNQFQRAAVFLEFTVKNPETEEHSFEDFIFSINKYDVIFEDLAYLPLSNRGYSKDDEYISNFSITNYSYNAETNALSFSFSFDVDADSNITGHDLSIQGEVDVITVKRIIEDVVLPPPSIGKN
ncbi:hypothetical protein ABW636_03550 [Aquimarina sp. 2201CG1-2-11]|uniref:hypothetical protein n=1 Tax=Aquimarina discodermiae TaxID=3231043 RepID=UPI0034626040